MAAMEARYGVKLATTLDPEQPWWDAVSAQKGRAGPRPRCIWPRCLYHHPAPLLRRRRCCRCVQEEYHQQYMAKAGARW